MLSQGGIYDISNEGFPFHLDKRRYDDINLLLDKTLEKDDPRSYEIYLMFKFENHKLLTLILALYYDYRGNMFTVNCDLLEILCKLIVDDNYCQNFKILINLYTFLLGNFCFKDLSYVYFEFGIINNVCYKHMIKM